ncbi:initiator tRNA phosphoribosyl transferase-domain-containing protein [Russula brevipes]|nr:initiator tRNA phosphoribosyl transferase-domain-containing protein [Russula brevipes]
MPKTSEASARAHIRRESLDIYNRLHSIDADIAFVDQVRAAYPTLPLIPNLRCGAWYTDPTIAHPTAHAYFKSTDGHHGNWAFNLRRPNIHLLPVAAAHDGLILVDSTRAGKRLPDALSKTVPIWCAVINRAVHLRSGGVGQHAAAAAAADTDTDEEAEGDPWKKNAVADLCTPPGAVGAHEHAQIAARLESWAVALADSSYALPELARPLRPLWITPASARFPHVAPDAPFVPVICVSASRAVDEGTERRTGGFSYVQGSGDDHELWGQGLTPQLFWRHRAELLARSREEVEAVVARLVVAAAPDTEQCAERLEGAWSAPPTPVLKVGGRVLFCTLGDLPRGLPVSSRIPGPCEREQDDDDDDEGEISFIVVGTSDAATNAAADEPVVPTEARPADRESQPGAARVLRLRVSAAAGRRGRHAFVHEVLPRAVEFASLHLGLGRRICVAGGDEGIGVLLVLLQLFFDDGGGRRVDDIGTPPAGAGDGGTAAAAGKSSVRTRLEWIIASRPEVNPTRAVLKRVNDFLLSPRLHCEDGVA